MMITRQELYAAPADRPRSRRASEHGHAGVIPARWAPVMDLREVTRNGMTTVRVGGCASTVETAYQMYDEAGPYNEIVARGVFASALLFAPSVEFTVNHGAGGGLPMAHTRNGTLELAESFEGFDFDAFVDPGRADVQVMLAALKRGDLAEASFKFRITRGMWSPDWSQFRIEAIDLNGGDVSAVNFGANPTAYTVLRAATASDEARARYDAAAYRR